MEDLVEKVREYAGDPSLGAKPRRPLTGYYPGAENDEAASQVIPLNVAVKDHEEERNSLPRVKARGSTEALAQKSRSMEDLSTGSSREVLDEVLYYTEPLISIHIPGPCIVLYWTIDLYTYIWTMNYCPNCEAVI